MTVTTELSCDQYEIRRQFRLLGCAYRICDALGQRIFFVSQDTFSLHDDIHLYADEQAQMEVLTIRVPQLADGWAVYDVVDAASGKRRGVLRRKAKWYTDLLPLAALLLTGVKDEWVLLDAEGQEIGAVREDHWRLVSALRRFFWFQKLLHKRYVITVDGTPVGTIKQSANPFVRKLVVDFSSVLRRAEAKGLGLCVGILIWASEEDQYYR